MAIVALVGMLGATLAFLLTALFTGVAGVEPRVIAGLWLVLALIAEINYVIAAWPRTDAERYSGGEWDGIFALGIAIIAPISGVVGVVMWMALFI